MTNIIHDVNYIHDINNYILEGLYTDTHFYKHITAFINFHLFKCFLFNTKSCSIDIMLFLFQESLHLWIWNFACKKNKMYHVNLTVLFFAVL